MIRVIAIMAAGMMISIGPAYAQSPKRGGELRAAITAETNTTDCHAGVSFTTVHHLSPHYSFLLRHDPERFPAIKGDLAESWTISPDGLTYTFTLKQPVKFHDGTALTSADVRASYERLRKPPEGVAAVRRANVEPIESIETPDAKTVVFRLSKADAAMLTEFASPWNCIYSAAKLGVDPTYPAKEIMGSGPFKFASRTPGAEWVGVRNPDYFVSGQPYLDGFRLILMAGSAVPNAIQGGAVDGEFRFVTPGQRDQLVQAAGDRLQVLEAPLASAILVAFNSEQPPFNDVRVRRALSMAIDRQAGQNAIRRITNTRIPGGFLRPGNEFALANADLQKRPGFGAGIDADRAEARKLLAEAGQAQLKFKLTNRNVQDPFQNLGIFVIDQWRRIGVTVEQELLDVAQHTRAISTGNFTVALDSHSDYIDEPSLMLSKFLSTDRAPPPRNIARYTDREIDRLYDAQRGATDATARRALLRQLEERLLSEAHFSPVFWGERITVLSKAVRGWHALPSHFLNQSLAEVWLDR